MEALKRKVLADMQRKDIVGEYKTATLTHYDGCTRKLLYSDIQTFFPHGKKIISITDVDGYITHANSVFTYMSGYSKDELIGSPHYILRHPDMPRIAFTGLWDSLAKTGHWHGYVKNLRKDGGYYWVFAEVFALHRNGKTVGYTSARSEAPIDKVRSCTKLYRQLLQEEQSREHVYDTYAGVALPS